MAWVVDGDISETAFETTWVCTAYDLLSGAIVGTEVVTTGNTFTISVPSADPVRVCVEPRRFDIWRDSANVGINQRVYPTNPVATPYYYRCVVAGVTGATEPIWDITENATFTDGSTQWIRVERINQPTCHSPLIPTVE